MEVIVHIIMHCLSEFSKNPRKVFAYYSTIIFSKVSYNSCRPVRHGSGREAKYISSFWGGFLVLVPKASNRVASDYVIYGAVWRTHQIGVATLPADVGGSIPVSKY